MKRALAFALALASCAESKNPTPPMVQKTPGSFATPAPPAVFVRPLDFAAYGDCRSDQTIHGRICRSILAGRPKFVLVSGDLVDWADSAEDWEEFRATTKELRSKVAYYPAAGNHDVSDRRPFEKEFGLDRTYYDKRIGDVHVFFLDSNWYFREPEQLAWLEEKAGASDARHKFAVFHHPPFSIDTFGEFETRPIRERVHPILARLKFCAAFCGHNHHFYTTRRDGVRYVITAGGGAVLYPLDPEKAEPGDLFRKFHHFVGCRFGEKKISAHVFDPDGAEVPELGFTLCEH